MLKSISFFFIIRCQISWMCEIKTKYVLKRNVSRISIVLYTHIFTYACVFIQIRIANLPA